MRTLIIIGAAALMLSAAAFSQQETPQQTTKEAPQGTPQQMPQHHGMMNRSTAVTKAIAVLSPAPNSKVEGTVTFEKTDAGIKIIADVTGLTPGKHGFHIHEFGDCSSSDFTSAGSHFMMGGENHGAPQITGSHMGDLGNLTADASGKAHIELVDDRITLFGPNSIIGRSVVVHESEDDLKTQPTGNSGARVACGVIGIAKP